MRRRDPRRLLPRRRRLAEVRLLDAPHSWEAPDGSVTSAQTAEVSLPGGELERLWTPEYLERLARTYWRFLSRVSLGLLRVLYTEDSRSIVLVGRPLVLLRFFAPEYDVRPDFGSVTWRIDRGLLVAPRGRGRGYLRIWVRRHRGRSAGGSSEATVTVSSEVASFFPMLAGSGWLSGVGRALYRFSQLRVHVVVTNAFLRSLARLDLAPSVVGRFAPGRELPAEAGREAAASRGARR